MRIRWALAGIGLVVMGAILAAIIAITVPSSTRSRTKRLGDLIAERGSPLAIVDSVITAPFKRAGTQQHLELHLIGVDRWSGQVPTDGAVVVFCEHRQFRSALNEVMTLANEQQAEIDRFYAFHPRPEVFVAHVGADGVIREQEYYRMPYVIFVSSFHESDLTGGDFKSEPE